MATLINGNGNCPVTAQQDADFFQGILGGSFVKMLPVGNEMAYTIADANTITLSDGECIDSEGRRIHIDVGNTDSFTIPTGTSGQTAYYIIGYILAEDSDGNEAASTFVEETDSASSTLDEESLRDGASSKYVSLYRVTQEGLSIASVEALFTTLTGITGKLDGETLVTTLSEAISAGEEAAPACSVIAEMYENFQDGCSTIAAALNSAGVTTASNASAATMAGGIASLYNSRYNAGYTAAMVGNAAAAQVLKGYTFTNASNVNAVGTMNNWGSNSVSMSSNTATLSAGYYSSISINAASRYSAGYNSGYSVGYAVVNNSITIHVVGSNTAANTTNGVASASFSTYVVINAKAMTITSANATVSASANYWSTTSSSTVTSSWSGRTANITTKTIA